MARVTRTSKYKTGDRAPSFETILDTGEKLSSASLKGKKYILTFYNHDDSETCTKQVCSVRDVYDEIRQHGYVVFGVSEDGVKKHTRFIAKHRVPFSLISDEGNHVAKAFDIYGEKKFMGRISDAVHRAAFIIGSDGMIEAVINPIESKIHGQQLLDAIQQRTK